MDSISGEPAGVTPSDQHRAWCHPPECLLDTENHLHRSVTSTVNTVITPRPVLQVSAQEFFSADHDGQMEPVEEFPDATVYLREHGNDGWDLTPQEARQLGQALILHADQAAGGEADPLDQAATLVVAALAYTGRDPNELHRAIVDLLGCAVDAMAEARRR